MAALHGNGMPLRMIAIEKKYWQVDGTCGRGRIRKTEHEVVKAADVAEDPTTYGEMYSDMR